MIRKDASLPNALQKYAQNLAQQHKSHEMSSGKCFIKRQLKKDIRVLNTICQEYRSSVQAKANIPSAGEWLIDNQYLINEQSQFVLRNLPGSYCRRLPVFKSGPLRGVPRIYAVVLGLLEHTDGKSDANLLEDFLWEYQKALPLTMGELWAVPLVLRIAIVHKLRLLFEEINRYFIPKKQANLLMKKIVPILSDVSEALQKIIAAAEKHLDLTNPTVLVHLARQFRDYIKSTPLLRWLDARTAIHNLSLTELIEEEQIRQTQHRVAAGQLISSLREISHTVWEFYFEVVSLVEQTLRRDPARVYSEMDFNSRDMMRHTLEGLAKRWKVPEHELAEHILSLAMKAKAESPEHRLEQHVGYYLFGSGRADLLHSLGIKSQLWCHPREILNNYPNIVYFSSLFLLVNLFIYAAWDLLNSLAILSARQMVLVLLITFVPAGEWALRQLHWILTIIFPPQRLPKLEYRGGIPKEAATMVVIPTIINSVEIAAELVHRLELYHLANPDPHIYFALLTDWPDAPQESMPEDAVVLNAVQTGIAALNARYPHPRGSTYFHLFHRRRLWNPKEGKWMGWERKRGKLTEFNALLCGEKQTSFALMDGDSKVLPTIRYVITLDSDTQLPRDAAVRLIGTISHPLNSPVLNTEKNRIIRGYGLLQPRISVSNASINRSRFAFLFGDKSGIDAYSGAVSDPYQDLFQYGIFTGKGIYDVRVFHQLLGDRIPENMVLSHDLLEGGFLHAGLITDVELIDDYPSSYLSSLSRMHRWVRGDWQLLPWLGPFVRDLKGRKRPVGLPLVTRWQMIDNLRRSLLGPALWTLIWFGLIILPRPVAFLRMPLLITGGISMLTYIHNLLRNIRQGTPLFQNMARAAFNLLVLPYHSLTMADAITRTLYRLSISHRKLLEWVPAAEEGKKAPTRLLDVWKRMLGGQLLILGCLVVAGLINPAALPWAAPLALFWISAPFWVHRISLPIRERDYKLQLQDRAFLRNIALRTWLFFEKTTGPENHWLPPDNLQIEPANGLARRTSPTNIGLMLASTVAALDFGYITTSTMLERIGRTIDTLESLPRWNGHFYNWYDTSTLEPLQPIYVSTVDSGNLVAYLLTTKQSLKDIMDRPLLNSDSVQGLIDIVRWESEKNPSIQPALMNKLESLLIEPPASIYRWFQILKGLIKDTPENSCLAMVLQNRLTELDSLFPWLKILETLDSIQIHDFECFEEVAATTVAPSLAGMKQKLAAVNSIPDVIAYANDLKALLKEEIPHNADNPEVSLYKAVLISYSRISQLLNTAQTLMGRLEALAISHDFTQLYNPKRRLFAIGYNIASKQLDSSYYDLLASEARQASFVAIGLGQIPANHWFKLNRTMSGVQHDRVLVSWSGTMFEYLMPLLLMPGYPHTLWDINYRLVIKHQIRYASKLGLPWGISESGYNIKDFNLNYQYQAFGVPGLGLKQGLENDRVIAPYATFLAAQIAPEAAVRNLRLLEKYHALGEFGFYEAIDFTPDRLPERTRYVLIKSYMAHHQGMIMLSLANLLLQNRFQQRFLSEPRIKATELLLCERIPARSVTLNKKPLNLATLSSPREDSADLRTFYQVDTPLPEARFLSNGKYLVMVSNSGAGFSRWNNILLNRWSEDAVRDVQGTCFYIRNLTDNLLWSPTYQPCRCKADDSVMKFSLEKITYTRTDGDIHTSMEICVSPEMDVEIRQITLTNHGDSPCILEITSFMELAIAPMDDFNAHPAFKKLFVETEVEPHLEALLAHRRSGIPNDDNPWFLHMLVVDGHTIGAFEYETDRSRFIGRGRSASLPQVISTKQSLSGTVGTVLDPIFSLRRCVDLAPGRSARFTFVTGGAPSRNAALEIAHKLRSPFQLVRTFDLAWSRNRLELRELNLTPQQANLFQWMAAHLFYFNPYRRPRIDSLLQNNKGQSGLWAYGISGDLPVVLVRLADIPGIALAEMLIKAFKYWSLKGLQIDLVILSNFESSYEQNLQNSLQRLVESCSQVISNSGQTGKRGQVFLLSGKLLPPGDQVLLETVARLSLRDDRGNLLSQMLQLNMTSSPLPPQRETHIAAELSQQFTPCEAPGNLLFFNGYGGFSQCGREYTIYLKAKELLPVPWINVISNPKFGFQISESGGGYTWAENSREFKISPWSNDPVLDSLGEICYLRDEESGILWTLTPAPIRDNNPYLISHGQGYSTFTHYSQGIEQAARFFTPLTEPVKIIRLTLRNSNDRVRRLSATYYLEWVLGDFRAKTAPYIVTEIEPDSGALLARNVYQENFPGYSGFLQIWTDEPELERSWTGDRVEFIGRNGSLYRPAALERLSLSNRVGAGFNPCGAMQVKIVIPPFSETAVTILIGAAPSRDKARELIFKYRSAEKIREAYEEVISFWDELLSQVQVSTPDPGFNLMMNRWLLYQTLSCRIWSRSAFYQAGGAYGFRDQLQDVLALLHTRPSLAREQILYHAAHQFLEGDVQHWWHEETRHGIRSKFSDDLLWLPYVACRYVELTGDYSIWEESIPFLESPPLEETEFERYEPTRISDKTGTLYEHCIRAVNRALCFGDHGLPLMGAGDWNDAMNQVGRKKMGESVWLGWFLYTVLQSIIPVCDYHNDSNQTKKYRQAADELKQALDQNAWDGNWYRRAYNDLGEPLGSIQNTECQIDCIAQAWAVISGAAALDKAVSAMQALDHKLVSREESLVCLLTPPFSKTVPSPGYIQAYPPGVRENGGQYTHGAIWAIIAWAKLGEGNHAYELFRLLNPINHARTDSEVQRYRVEPYVMASDVYSISPYVGRGGWTWYTGAAGWMYQAGLEWLLGLRKKGPRLYLEPCIPEEWPEFSVIYKYQKTKYEIIVKNPSRKQTGGQSLEMDGKTLNPKEGIPLKDDNKLHRIILIL